MRSRPPRKRFPDSAGPSPPSGPLEPTPRIPRYKVILLDTADKELMFVVRTMMELTRFGEAEARHRMWQAHHCGRSLIFVTYFERAEFYVEQFTRRGLRVVMEPA